MSAPERIWAWSYDDCSSANEDEWHLNIPVWGDKNPHPIDAGEYIRADLAADLAAADAARIAELKRQLAEAQEGEG